MARTGIALSGGGVRGAAHVGVLRALEREGITPSYISGASAGALAAGMTACGLSVTELEQKIEELAALGNKLVDVNFCGFVGALFGRKVDGAIKGERLHRFIQDACGNRLLRQAELPVVIPAVDINAGKLVLFTSHKKELEGGGSIVVDDIPIADAVRASIAIPGVFRPFYMDGIRLVDGGVLNNLPANLLFLLGAESVLGVNVGYYGEPMPEVDSVIEIATQSVSLMGYTITRLRSIRSDYVLDVDTSGIGTLEFARAPEAMRTGSAATLHKMGEIKAALHSAAAIRRRQAMKSAAT